MLHGSKVVLFLSLAQVFYSHMDIGETGAHVYNQQTLIQWTASLHDDLLQSQSHLRTVLSTLTGTCSERLKPMATSLTWWPVTSYSKCTDLQIRWQDDPKTSKDKSMFGKAQTILLKKNLTTSEVRTDFFLHVSTDMTFEQISQNAPMTRSV